MAVAADPALVREETATPGSSQAATARETGGGGQLDLELDGIAQIPLKNPGKLRMKLKEKDLESTWEKGWKHDVHVTHVVILGKFFHSVRWRH